MRFFVGLILAFGLVGQISADGHEGEHEEDMDMMDMSMFEDVMTMAYDFLGFEHMQGCDEPMLGLTMDGQGPMEPMCWDKHVMSCLGGAIYIEYDVMNNMFYGVTPFWEEEWSVHCDDMSFMFHYKERFQGFNGLMNINSTSWDMMVPEGDMMMSYHMMQNKYNHNFQVMNMAHKVKSKQLHTMTSDGYYLEFNDKTEWEIKQSPEMKETGFQKISSVWTWPEGTVKPMMEMDEDMDMEDNTDMMMENMWMSMPKKIDNTFKWRHEGNYGKLKIDAVEKIEFFEKDMGMLSKYQQNAEWDMVGQKGSRSIVLKNKYDEGMWMSQDLRVQEKMGNTKVMDYDIRSMMTEWYMPGMMEDSEMDGEMEMMDENMFKTTIQFSVLDKVANPDIKMFMADLTFMIENLDMCMSMCEDPMTFFMYQMEQPCKMTLKLGEIYRYMDSEMVMEAAAMMMTDEEGQMMTMPADKNGDEMMYKMQDEWVMFNLKNPYDMSINFRFMNMPEEMPLIKVENMGLEPCMNLAYGTFMNYESWFLEANEYCQIMTTVSMMGMMEEGEMVEGQEMMMPTMWYSETSTFMFKNIVDWSFSCNNDESMEFGVMMGKEENMFTITLPMEYGFEINTMQFEQGVCDMMFEFYRGYKIDMYVEQRFLMATGWDMMDDTEPEPTDIELIVDENMDEENMDMYMMWWEYVLGAMSWADYGIEKEMDRMIAMKEMCAMGYSGMLTYYGITPFMEIPAEVDAEYAAGCEMWWDMYVFTPRQMVSECVMETRMVAADIAQRITNILMNYDQKVTMEFDAIYTYAMDNEAAWKEEFKSMMEMMKMQWMEMASVMPAE